MGEYPLGGAVFEIYSGTTLVDSVTTYHNEPTHPHCHAVFFSEGKQPYMTRRGIDNIRSALARDIFKQDLMQIYEQQTHHRDGLRREAREIVRRISAGSYSNPVAEDLLRRIAEKLAVHKGKKVYGYLDQTGRNICNAITDELARDERIAELYNLWYEQREAVLATYRSEMPERVPLSQNGEFKAIKNAIIAEAALLLPEQMQTERQDSSQQGQAQTQTAGHPQSQPPQQQDKAQQHHDTNGTVAMGSLRLLGQLSRIIENKIDEGPKQEIVESKLLAEIRT